MTTRMERFGNAELYFADSCELLTHFDLGDKPALLTDPPYGIDYTSGWPQGKAVDETRIIGDFDTAARDAVLALCLAHCPRAFVFGDRDRPKPQGTVATLIWWRPGSGMGDLALPWKPDYEEIYAIGKDFLRRQRGDSVLMFPWDTFRGDADHPHQKPVPLLRQLLSHMPDDVILDPFMGSGSTGVACAQVGKHFIGIEKDPAYFEAACRRIEAAYKAPDFMRPTVARLDDG